MLKAIRQCGPLLLLACAIPASPDARAAQVPVTRHLTPEARERLRYRLEDLHNELDLLIRNRRSDEADLHRLKGEATGLRVYERIPFTEDFTGLKRDLADSARDAGLAFVRVRRLPLLRRPSAVPATVYSDEPAARLLPDQVALAVPFTVTVAGKSADEVLAWTRSWKTEQLRLAEPDGLPVTAGPKGRFTVRAHAYRFRAIRYPVLRPRDPMSLLPAWARENPLAFAHEEPRLWKLVARVSELLPLSPPLYEAQRGLLLEKTRLDFFFAKATPQAGEK